MHCFSSLAHNSTLINSVFRKEGSDKPSVPNWPNDKTTGMGDMNQAAKETDISLRGLGVVMTEMELKIE